MSKTIKAAIALTAVGVLAIGLGGYTGYATPSSADAARYQPHKSTIAAPSHKAASGMHWALPTPGHGTAPRTRLLGQAWDWRTAPSGSYWTIIGPTNGRGAR